MTFSFYANERMLRLFDKILAGYDVTRYGANWCSVEIDDADEAGAEQLRDILEENGCAWQEDEPVRRSRSRRR